MEYEGLFLYGKRMKLNDLWQFSGVAKTADCRRTSVCFCRWSLSEAKSGGEVQNVSVLVAVGVNDERSREIPGVAEGCRKGKKFSDNFLYDVLLERMMHSFRLFQYARLAGNFSEPDKIRNSILTDQITDVFIIPLLSFRPR